VLVLKRVGPEEEEDPMVMELVEVLEEDNLRPASHVEASVTSLGIVFKDPNVTIVLALVTLARIVLNRSDVHVTRAVLKAISLAIVLELASLLRMLDDPFIIPMLYLCS